MADPSFDLFVKYLTDNKAPDTKKIYLERFANFAEIAKTTSATLAKLGPSAIEDKVKDYIDQKVQGGAGYSYLNQAVSAIRLFCLANRINVNKDWLYAQIPKPDSAGQDKKNFDDDQPYSKDQINAMLEAAKGNIRGLSAITVMATGGPRIGALPSMRAEPAYCQMVEKHNVLAIQAYPKTTAAYWVLLPPKASHIILKYKGARSKGPLFTNKFDDNEPANKKSLQTEIWKIAIKAKVRKANRGGDTLRRHDNMLNHAFRKYHSTTLEKAGLRDDPISRLRGNKKGLKGVYQLPSPLETIEITGFMQAVPFLELEALPIIK